MKINDRKFLKFVKNTKNDLVQNPDSDTEIINWLKEIYNKKELTIINVQSLYYIIEARKENFDYIKLIQDTESFNIVNKEHKYMESFINKYFEFNVCPMTDLKTISLKGVA